MLQAQNHLYRNLEPLFFLKKKRMKLLLFNRLKRNIKENEIEFKNLQANCNWPNIINTVRVYNMLKSFDILKHLACKIAYLCM